MGTFVSTEVSLWLWGLVVVCGMVCSGVGMVCSDVGMMWNA